MRRVMCCLDLLFFVVLCTLSYRLFMLVAGPAPAADKVRIGGAILFALLGFTVARIILGAIAPLDRAEREWHNG